MLEIDKSRFKDEKGNYITQGLFHEFAQTPKHKFYSVQGWDVTNNGKTYISLKNLYLEMEDPTEYLFANTYLYDWNHWQRICRNKVLQREIQTWRRELELRLRAKGIVKMRQKAAEGNQEAIKWLAEGRWDAAVAGRPRKKDLEEAVESVSNDTDGAHIYSILREVKSNG